MRSFLKIGAIAGAMAGLFLALFLEIVGEPTISRAVSLEERATAGSSNEVFSRVTQQIGGGIGAVLYGVCLGLVFGVVFAAIRHHLSARTDWRRATLLAGAGFVTVYLVPFVKYPSNPPGMGDPNTITRRTVLYVIMLAWSVVATWSAWRLSRWLRHVRRLGEERWVPLTAIAYAAIVGAGLAALPGPPDKVTVPAYLLWRFRLATAGGAAVFWTVLGLTAGYAAMRPNRTRDSLPNQEDRVSAAG